MLTREGQTITAIRAATTAKSWRSIRHGCWSTHGSATGTSTNTLARCLTVGQKLSPFAQALNYDLSHGEDGRQPKSEEPRPSRGASELGSGRSLKFPSR